MEVGSFPPGEGAKSNPTEPGVVQYQNLIDRDGAANRSLPGLRRGPRYAAPPPLADHPSISAATSPTAQPRRRWPGCFGLPSQGCRCRAIPPHVAHRGRPGRARAPSTRFQSTPSASLAPLSPSLVSPCAAEGSARPGAHRRVQRSTRLGSQAKMASVEEGHPPGASHFNTATTSPHNSTVWHRLETPGSHQRGGASSPLIEKTCVLSHLLLLLPPAAGP